MKPKLLVIELWGVGDLALATQFLRVASENFSVTLLAKPHALELRDRFWPDVKIIPLVVPWTAFRGKYQLPRWPWREIMRVRKILAAEHFEIGVSGRHDPRDHVLLKLAGPKKRLGFSRTGSRFFLTQSLPLPATTAHRYENWRIVGEALGLDLPEARKVSVPPLRHGSIFIHSGAGQPLRVWPLERYRNLVRRLRQENHTVTVACDQDQRKWWLAAGETEVATPGSIKELIGLLDHAAVFIGNDSGAGHVAAINGLPTFTIFGPQLSERFLPLHPAAAWIDGKPCPYKPCSDYCQFPTPHCIMDITEAEVWVSMTNFLRNQGAR